MSGECVTKSQNLLSQQRWRQKGDAKQSEKFRSARSMQWSAVKGSRVGILIFKIPAALGVVSRTHTHILATRGSLSLSLAQQSAGCVCCYLVCAARAAQPQRSRQRRGCVFFHCLIVSGAKKAPWELLSAGRLEWLAGWHQRKWGGRGQLRGRPINFLRRALAANLNSTHLCTGWTLSLNARCRNMARARARAPPSHFGRTAAIIAFLGHFYFRKGENLPSGK